MGTTRGRGTISRLPVPGSDRGVWGEILNEFLGVSLNADGTLARGSELDAATAHVADASIHRSSVTFRISTGWAVGGYVVPASGENDYINPIFVSVPAGQTTRLVKVRHRIHAGTSATVSLQRNGSDIAGLAGLSLTTTATSNTPSSTVTLADDDELALVVTAVSGSPQNLSFTVFYDVTV